MHVLDLGNNSISKEGASALAAYMKKSSALKELNLYMNDIGTAGITQVRHGTAPKIVRSFQASMPHQARARSP